MPDLQAHQVMAQLTEDERSLVGVLAAIYDARLGRKHLLRIAGVAASSPALDTLIRHELVRAHSPRYSLAPAFAPSVLGSIDAAAWSETCITYFDAWLRAPATTWRDSLAEAEAIMSLAEDAAASGRWRAVLLLTRGIEPALIAGKQWGAWQRVLDLRLQGARALGDLTVEGWTLHQLGTRALCLGNPTEAQRLLNQAMTIRRGLGDGLGSEATQHNLALIQMPPDGPTTPQDRPSGPQPPRIPPTGRPPQPSPQASPRPSTPLPAWSQTSTQRAGATSRRGGWLWLWGLVFAGLLIGALWFAQRPQSGLRVPAPPATPVSPTDKVAPSVPVVNPTAPAQLLPPTKAPPPPPPAENLVQPNERSKDPEPEIVSFTADPTALTLGESAVLRWDTINASSVSIEPDVGQVKWTGEWSVQPQETTTYRLTAMNDAGATQIGTVTIVVSQPQIVQPSAPDILEFYADPPQVSAGSTTQLCYQTINAFDVEIMPEPGSLSKLGFPLDKGCTEVRPAVEGIVYTLTVYDQNAQPVTQEDVFVTVLPPE